MSDVRLQMEAVAFRRGEATVLQGIDWRVRQGEHWAVLGPNGSGKTTLMLAASGYVPTSGGRVFLLEGYMSDIALPRVRRRVGIASAALHDHMLRHRRRSTGLEVVLSGRDGSLGLFRRPTAEEVDRAEELLDQFGARALRDMRFDLMSTGQRQRCLVARCYMAQSDLVILDEPCAGLDIAAREKLLQALRSACCRFRDTPHVLVTHHPSEIVPEITHVLMLRGGRVLVQAPRDEALTEENLRAAFGTPLHVVRDDGRVWVLPAGGSEEPGGR